MTRLAVGAALLFGATLGFVALAFAEPDRAAADRNGSSSAAQRIYADGQRLWIYPEPRRSLHAIGYLRAGQSMPGKAVGKRRGGCTGQWHEVEPFGFVCMGPNATLDPDKRYVRAMSELRPADAFLPYKYALSHGAPMYRRVPAPEEWRKRERVLGPPRLDAPLPSWHRGHARLAESKSIEPTGAMPFFLMGKGSTAREHESMLLRRMIPLGSALAYTRAFERDGRTWLVSADGTIVPADRVRPYRESSFQGFALGHRHKLPGAWIRSRARPSYRRAARGMQPQGQWPAKSYVPLDPAQRVLSVGRGKYLATLELGPNKERLYIDAADATVVDTISPPQRLKHPNEKWIVFSITQGTLVAYVGTTPVYATLASPGMGGVPRPGGNHVKDSTTPIGTYSISFKHLSDDMSPEEGDDRKFWLADVPYTQYFSQPFAIHVAYWHENFGDPMSAGCINVSPRDGKWLFSWTDPALPNGWAGVGVGQQTGGGTRLIILR